MAQTNVNPEFVERYAQALQRQPRSRVFAPLSEAYRKMGFLDEAKRICRFGCEANPDFAGGHVAYAKVLLDLKAPTDALIHLEKATQLSPDNLLANHLLGETLIELRRPKEALKAFKMVLFLDPDNDRAKQAVKKWEFLTADEYGNDVFPMKSTVQTETQAEAKSKSARGLDDQLEDLLTESGIDLNTNSRVDLQQRHARSLERAVSLADAFTVRNDLEAAIRVLEEARRLLGPTSEIDSRHRLLTKRLAVLSETDDDVVIDDPSITLDPPPALEFHVENSGPTSSGPAGLRERQVLETLLRRINDRRT